MTANREILDTAFKLRALAARLEATANAPSTGRKTPVEHADPASAWRAAHKAGHPPKIDADPELRAFVIARIERLTFPELAAEIAARFPPERRVSKSSLHRWWQANAGGSTG